MMKKSLLVPALLMAVSVSQASKIYKWEDDQGNIHYGTSIPPEYQKKARDELNEQAVTTERVDRAKSAAELAAEAAAVEAAEKATKELEARRQEAAQIKAAYNSEEDILRRKTLRLEGVDRSVEISQDTLAGQEKNMAMLKKQAADQERSGRVVSKALLSSISSLEDQMARQKVYLEAKKAERDEIAAEFDHILSEYRRVQSEGL